MNVNASSAASTLVPQPTAPGTGESAGQNWAASKEVENWATAVPAAAPGAPQDSWATTQEATNWAGDEPAPEPATQRVDIKV